MDREIPQEVKRKELRSRIVRISVAAVAAVGLIGLLMFLLRSRVDASEVSLATVDTGIVEVSVSASGKVIPAFEEIINSPIDTKIVETYRKGGDSVDVGTPILKLDLQSTETEYRKLLDEEQMKEYQLEQLKVNTRTSISNLSMQIKVSAMKLSRMEAELQNERYLDSIGAGTTEKVREVELNCNVARLELEQLRQQYDNEQQVLAANLKVKELELNIFRKSLAEMRRTLADAQLRSPRKAVLTYINDQIGAQVSKGTQVAVISDLSHFKVEGEISDTYASHLSVGSKATVVVGGQELAGVVGSVTPLSRNGVVSFSVQLDEDSHSALRSGAKADVHIVSAVKEEAVRLANAPYYVGRGTYELFVLQGSELVKRRVELGDSNYKYVEVLSGLKPGDRVVVSDMEAYRAKKKLRVSGLSLPDPETAPDSPQPDSTGITR